MRAARGLVRALLLITVAGLVGGCATIARNVEDLRQSLRDAQAERDLQAQKEEEQAEQELARTNPALFRIRQKWKELRPRYPGPRFAVPPRAAAPYAAGELSAGFLEDGLAMTRFVRFLAGVPDDVELSADLCAAAQHGAVVLAALGILSHAPPRPPDMPLDFYQRGLASTGSSNIHQSSGSGDSLASAVVSFMDDSDPGNIDRVGHRRWVLSPVMKRLGFGSAVSRNGDVFTTMEVFDNGNEGQRPFDFIRWPPEGTFVVEMFSATQAWSVCFNPAKYRVPRVENLRVTLTRKADGARWEITSRDADPRGAYLHLDTAGYGYQSAIIFRPAPGFSIEAGDTFGVSLTGLGTLGGAAKKLDYEVTFARLSDSPWGF